MLRCTFCEKYENEVYKIIPTVGAAICDECVDLSSDIIKKCKEIDNK